VLVTDEGCERARKQRKKGSERIKKIRGRERAKKGGSVRGSLRIVVNVGRGGRGGTCRRRRRREGGRQEMERRIARNVKEKERKRERERGGESVALATSRVR